MNLRIHILQVHPLPSSASSTKRMYILDLDTREFAPQLAGVEDIVNYVLESLREQHVSKL
ncbi:hypothetical protein GMDG_01726 [Pseudogymnoascus destructans 20631-21]|uniref:Uncharacterized protein n=1 Tax=Pseudogymnoascus destructans (strain ATCC MYA-4855 / 20631-21) TaxID=658429 RepID=L8G0C6_PSED2|nr:hypothetical protein GMDG_01726 [Pseudogymnoascus destructans 20631-21]